MKTYDTIVIGAGIAGASVTWRLAERQRVLLVDMESVSGYHSSGRSATYFNLGLGSDVARAFSAASWDFLRDPPASVASHNLLNSCHAITVASASRSEALFAHLGNLRRFVAEAQPLALADLVARVPVIRPSADGIAAAIIDPKGARLDGHALLQGYLSAARRLGAEVLFGAEVSRLERVGSRWRVSAGAYELEAARIVDAAGAWGDAVARLAGARPVGLQPMRRTIAVLDAPPGVSTHDWPFVRDLDQRFYFTGESGGILLSPADETPVAPQDAQPDPMDVAVAIDRFEQLTTIDVRRVRTQWAGLRSFVSDRHPVIGFDSEVDGFFWSVGQGGVGLQTSPAWSAAAAALLLDRELPDYLRARELTAEQLSPVRLQRAPASPSTGAAGVRA